MRINGFTQIKAFYSWSFDNQEKGVKPQHVSLYLFLLNQNNRNNWVEWFKCPYDLAMVGSCISSKKTYYACLKDLQEWGLIEYQKGVNNWKAPIIKLEVLKDTSTVPQSEPQVLPLPIQAGTQADAPLPIHIYKLVTSNLELVTKNLKGWIENESSKNSEKEFSEAVRDCFVNCLDFFPEHYKPKNQKITNQWMDTIHKLNTIEQIPFDSIEAITKWAREGWWSKNFQSLLKLRKKNSDGIMYLSIFNDGMSAKPVSNGKSTAESRAEINRRIIEDLKNV